MFSVVSHLRFGNFFMIMMAAEPPFSSTERMWISFPEKSRSAAVPPTNTTKFAAKVKSATSN